MESGQVKTTVSTMAKDFDCVGSTKGVGCREMGGGYTWRLLMGLILQI